MIGYSTQWVGNVSMVVYALVTALSSILIHDTNQAITPLLSAFYTFLFCLLVYHVFAKGLINKKDDIKHQWVNIAILNVTTAICWIFSFISLTWIPPELFLYIYLCAMPITASCLYKTQWIKAGLYSIGLILLTYTYTRAHLLAGFGLAFLGGASGTVYSIYSKKMTRLFSAMEILSLRFYLTVLITGLLCLYYSHFQWLSAESYVKFGFLSLVSVILPLILFQLGIQCLSVNKTIAYLPLSPLLCYFISGFLNQTSFSHVQLLAIAFLSLAMIIKIE